MLFGKSIGPAWRTEEAYRVRELLAEKNIPFDTNLEKDGYACWWAMPNRERKWTFEVPARRLKEVTEMLAREGLINPDMLIAG